MQRNRSTGRTWVGVVLATSLTITAFGSAAAATKTTKNSTRTTKATATTAALVTTAAPAPNSLKTDKGVSDKEISIGLLNGFTGPIAALAAPAGDGAKAYYAWVNSQGGVCGRQLVAKAVDTKYDPQVATQVYRANKDDVVMFSQLVGAASIFGLSKDIERDGIATLAATGAADVMVLPNVFGFITPFTFEAITAIDWALKNQPGKDGTLKIGVIYQGDAFGQEGQRAVRYVAKNEPRVKIVAEASYAAADVDFTAQVTKMRDAGADVVWLSIISSKLGAIVGAAKQLGFKGTFLGNTSSYNQALAKSLGDSLENYLTMSSTAAYGDKVEQMDKLLEFTKKVNSSTVPDAQAIFGWISSAVATAAIRKACAAGDLTQAGVRRQFDDLTVDVGGIGPKLHYGKTLESRIPSRQAAVNQIDLKTGIPRPLTALYEADLSKKWTIADLAQ